MSFCVHCGYKCEDKDSFCPGCGEPLKMAKNSNSNKDLFDEYTNKASDFIRAASVGASDIFASSAKTVKEYVDKSIEQLNAEDVKFRSLTCPNCGAELNGANDSDTLSCPYCGKKVIIEGQSAKVIGVKILNRVIDKVDDYNKVNAEVKKEKLRQKAIEREKARKNAVIVLLVCFALAAFLTVFSLFAIKMNDSNIQKEEAVLQELVDRTQEYINNEDYDNARITANQIVFSSNDDKKEEKWNSIRQGLIEVIDSKSEK